jgi:hypothetical protein
VEHSRVIAIERQHRRVELLNQLVEQGAFPHLTSAYQYDGFASPDAFGYFLCQNSFDHILQVFGYAKIQKNWRNAKKWWDSLHRNAKSFLKFLH